MAKRAKPEQADPISGVLGWHRRADLAFRDWPYGVPIPGTGHPSDPKKTAKAMKLLRELKKLCDEAGA